MWVITYSHRRFFCRRLGVCVLLVGCSRACKPCSTSIPSCGWMAAAFSSRFALENTLSWQNPLKGDGVMAGNSSPAWCPHLNTVLFSPFSHTWGIAPLCSFFCLAKGQLAFPAFPLPPVRPLPALPTCRCTPLCKCERSLPFHPTVALVVWSALGLVPGTRIGLFWSFFRGVDAQRFWGVICLSSTLLGKPDTDRVQDSGWAELL